MAKKEENKLRFRIAVTAAWQASSRISNSNRDILSAEPRADLPSSRWDLKTHAEQAAEAKRLTPAAQFTVGLMSSLAIIGFVLMVSGFSIWMVAGFRYDPYIQRYLEKFGVAPSAFFSEFRDYVNAKKIAKKWGHRPEFIRGYEKLGVFALALFVFGLLLLLSVEFLGLGESID